MKYRLDVFICSLAVCVLTAGLAFGEHPTGEAKGQKPDPAARFAKMDADGNGSVSLEEFKASHEKRMEAMKKHKGENAPAEGRTPPPPEKIFERMDRNGDGAISLEEFKSGPKGRKEGKGAHAEKEAPPAAPPAE
jgi:Ca2+-binding EF-hand superfamily protein